MIFTTNNPNSIIKLFEKTAISCFKDNQSNKVNETGLTKNRRRK